MSKNIQLCAVAAAISALAAGAASAQTVTLYGRIDTSVQVSSKTAGNDERLTEVISGGIRPSIWGLRGTEDLGGGLSGFFNLEAHFAGDTGASTGPGAGALGSGGFRRQANVGLKSDLGTITLGRQYSPAILAGLGTEPRAFKEQFSGLYTYAYNQQPGLGGISGGSNPVNDLGIFLGNSVSYSNTFGPIYFGAAITAGEGTGKTYAFGASYTGPVVVSAAYQKINANVAGDRDEDGTEHYSIGAALPLGAFTIKGQWQYFEDDNSLTTTSGKSEVDQYGLGADFAWNPSNTLNLTYYYAKDDRNSNDTTKTLILSNDYAISKRTVLYVQAAFADADSGSTLRTSVIANGVFPDEKTTVFGVGVSHNF